MQDAIDLSTVEYVNSPNISDWPITSEFRSLRFENQVISVDHSRLGLWPPVPYESTTQEATIWVFFRIGGRWLGTGGERLRPGQRDKSLDAPSHIGPGWLYAADRWREMANYVPRPGELVGFLIAAGDTRGGGNVVLRERTNVVVVKFPDDAGGRFPPFETLNTPAVPAPPAELPTRPDDDPHDDILVAALHVNSENLTRVAVALESVSARLAAVQQAGFKVHW